MINIPDAAAIANWAHRDAMPLARRMAFPRDGNRSVWTQVLVAAATALLPSALVGVQTGDKVDGCSETSWTLPTANEDRQAAEGSGARSSSGAIHGARYRDKRPIAESMWQTVMETMREIGALKDAG